MVGDVFDKSLADMGRSASAFGTANAGASFSMPSFGLATADMDRQSRAFGGFSKASPGSFSVEPRRNTSYKSPKHSSKRKRRGIGSAVVGAAVEAAAAIKERRDMKREEKVKESLKKSGVKSKEDVKADKVLRRKDIETPDAPKIGQTPIADRSPSATRPVEAAREYRKEKDAGGDRDE